MPDYRAGQADEITLRAGQTVTLESLRQAVIPPYLMLMPFLDPPPEVEVTGQKSLGEDGVHGCIFTLRGVRPGSGQARTGFKDLQTGKVTHERMLTVVVTA